MLKTKQQQQVTWGEASPAPALHQALELPRVPGPCTPPHPTSHPLPVGPAHSWCFLCTQQVLSLHVTRSSPCSPCGGGEPKPGWSDPVWACWLIWFFIPVSKTNQKNHPTMGNSNQNLLPQGAAGHSRRKPPAGRARMITSPSPEELHLLVRKKKLDKEDRNVLRPYVFKEPNCTPRS